MLTIGKKISLVSNKFKNLNFHIFFAANIDKKVFKAKLQIGNHKNQKKKKNYWFEKIMVVDWLVAYLFEINIENFEQININFLFNSSAWLQTPYGSCMAYLKRRI